MDLDRIQALMFGSVRVSQPTGVSEANGTALNNGSNARIEEVNVSGNYEDHQTRVCLSASTDVRAGEASTHNNNCTASAPGSSASEQHNASQLRQRTFVEAVMGNGNSNVSGITLRTSPPSRVEGGNIIVELTRKIMKDA